MHGAFSCKQNNVTDQCHQVLRSRLDWIEHGFTSAPTQYRLYGRRFEVKRPSVRMEWYVSMLHDVTVS